MSFFLHLSFTSVASQAWNYCKFGEKWQKCGKPKTIGTSRWNISKTVDLKMDDRGYCHVNARKSYLYFCYFADALLCSNCVLLLFQTWNKYTICVFWPVFCKRTKKSILPKNVEYDLALIWQYTINISLLPWNKTRVWHENYAAWQFCKY